MVGNLVEQQFLSSRNWPFGSALAMTIMAVVLVALLAFTAHAGGSHAMRRLGPLALTAFALAFFAFLYAALFVIVGYSFNANPVNMLVWDGFTLDWYKGLLGIGERALDVNQRAVYIESTPQLLAALRNSLAVAAVTTLFSCVVGTATALALSRRHFRGRSVYVGGMLLPMMMPDIVLGIGLLVFFSTIGMQLSLLTIRIGQCTFLRSYVFIVVRAPLAGLHPSLEEASADLGANERTTFRKVLLPQLAPGSSAGRSSPSSSRWMIWSSPTSSPGLARRRSQSSSSG